MRYYINLYIERQIWIIGVLFFSVQPLPLQHNIAEGTSCCEHGVIHKKSRTFFMIFDKIFHKNCLFVVWKILQCTTLVTTPVLSKRLKCSKLKRGVLVSYCLQLLPYISVPIYCKRALIFILYTSLAKFWCIASVYE